MSQVIEAKVVQLLARELGIASDQVDLQRHLADELHLDGDDFGMSFVPRVHKTFGVVIPIAEWETVRTGADVVALIERWTRS